MDLNAGDVHQKQFHDAWRGYNQEEVDDFLDRVAETLDRIQRENHALYQRMRELEQTVATSREAEEMLKKTLVTAQQAAEEAIGKAKAKAQQLVSEAEERSRRAADDARARAAQADAEMQRRSTEQERAYAARKRDLDASIERLRTYEAELKQRLKMFLEQQLRALDSLPDAAPPRVQGPSLRQASAAPPRAVASEPPRSEPPQSRHDADEHPRVVSEPEQTGEVVTPDDDAEVAPGGLRRSVRSLFWRDDA